MSRSIVGVLLQNYRFTCSLVFSGVSEARNSAGSSNTSLNLGFSTEKRRLSFQGDRGIRLKKSKFLFIGHLDFFESSGDGGKHCHCSNRKWRF